MNNMLEELLAEQHDRGGQYRMIQKPMRTTTLIDIQERQKLRCAKCGTNLSVKSIRNAGHALLLELLPAVVMETVANTRTPVKCNITYERKGRANIIVIHGNVLGDNDI